MVNQITCLKDSIGKHNTVNGHYYAIMLEETWFDAREKANNVGAYLATITTEQENNFINETFLPINGGEMWIGLEKIGSEFAWVTGEEYTYTKFVDEGDGNCIIIYPARSKNWYKRNCLSKVPSIIEFGDFLITTPIPSPTSTPIIPPSPTLIPPHFISLNESTLEANQLAALPPTGHTLGRINFTQIPTGNGTDGNGMEIRLQPGQGCLVVSNRQVSIDSLAHLTGYFRSTSKNVSLALVGLNSPIDGQIAWMNVTGDEVPIDQYRQFNLVYQPPSGSLQIAVQAVNPIFSAISATVYIDSLNVEPYPAEVTGSEAALEVDGGFESGLPALIQNINDMDGTITPFFESISDVAIRLSIQPEQYAANVGTTLLGVYDQFPFRILGQVQVRRESPPAGGTTAFVITNGFQNFGVFRHTGELPGTGINNVENLIVGSDFTVNNPDLPIIAIIQNGGPGVEASIVVDNLTVLKE